MVGGGDEGAADLGVGQALLSQARVQARIAMFEVGAGPIPALRMPAGKGHAQGPGQRSPQPVPDQQVPVVGVSAVEVHVAGPVGGNAPIGHGAHAADPGGHILKLVGREKIGAETVVSEAALGLQIAGQLLRKGVGHPVARQGCRDQKIIFS